MLLAKLHYLTIKKLKLESHISSSTAINSRLINEINIRNGLNNSMKICSLRLWDKQEFF